MNHKLRTVGDAKLTSNRELLAIHTKSQQRLDKIRMSAVSRSTAASAMIQAGGAASNTLAAMLPLENSPKVRRQLAQHAGAFTIVKAHRADAKARVLDSP